MDIVDFTKVKKILKKIPAHIVTKLRLWAGDVETHGIRKTRQVPGYHDEPLRGKRKGQRSIRLSRAYRAIYTESAIGEVNKHEY